MSYSQAITTQATQSDQAIRENAQYNDWNIFNIVDVKKYESKCWKPQSVVVAVKP